MTRHHVIATTHLSKSLILLYHFMWCRIIYSMLTMSTVRHLYVYFIAKSVRMLELSAGIYDSDMPKMACLVVWYENIISGLVLLFRSLTNYFWKKFYRNIQ